jgi:hypothetical protein
MVRRIIEVKDCKELWRIELNKQEYKDNTNYKLKKL